MANDPNKPNIMFAGEPKIKFLADHDISALAYRLVAYRELPNGSVEVFRAEPADYLPGRIEPTFTFRCLEDMQPLMNALWELGVRPNAYTITNEHFGSVKAHLEDMKRLVAKAYKVEFGNGKKD